MALPGIYPGRWLTAAIINKSGPCRSSPRPAAPHSKPPGHLRPSGRASLSGEPALRVGHQPWCQQIFRCPIPGLTNRALPAARPPSPPTPSTRPSRHPRHTPDPPRDGCNDAPLQGGLLIARPLYHPPYNSSTPQWPHQPCPWPYQPGRWQG
jgi:hypothetical protein